MTSCEALATKAELQELRRELQPLKVQVAGIGGEIPGLWEQLKGLGAAFITAVGATANSVEALKREIPNLKNQLAAEITRLRGELSSLSHRIANIEVQQRFFANRGDLVELEQRLKAELDFNDVQGRRAYDLYNELNQIVNDLKIQVATLNKEVLYANATINSGNNTIAQLNGDLISVQAIAIAANTKASVLANQVGYLSSQLDRILQSLNSQQEQNYDGDIAGLQQDLSYFQGVVSRLSATIEGNEALIRGMRSDVVSIIQTSSTSQQNQIQTIRDSTTRKLREFNQRIDTIRNAAGGGVSPSYVEQQTSNLAKVVDSKIASLQKDFDRTGEINQSKLDNLEQVIQGRLTGIQTDFNRELARSNVESSLAIQATKNTLTGTNRSVSYLQREVKAINTRAATTTSSINDLQSTDENVLERLDVLEANGGTVDLTEINNRLATVEEGIELNQEQYDSLLSGITTVDSKVGTVDSKVSSLNTGLGVLGTGISTYLLSRLSPQLTQLNSRLASVTGTISPELNRIRQGVTANTGAIGSVRTNVANQAKTLEQEFNEVKNRTSPQSLSNAAAQGVCSTTKPGGCLGSGGNWQNNLLNGFKNNLGNVIGAANTGLSGAILALSQSTNKIVKAMQPVINSVNTKQDQLGRAIKGFQDFSEKAWKATQLDKVLSMLNFVLATHNAMMLSRNLASTMGEATTTTLRFLKVKSPTGQDIDVNQVLGTSINSYLSQIFGAANISATKKTFAKFNRILTAANGVMWGIRQMKDASIEAAEVGFGWVAKIGNAMKIQGILEEDAFPWMKERPGFKPHYQGFRNSVDNLDEAASQINQLASSGIEFQEGFIETTRSFTELTKAIDDFDIEKADSEGAKDAESSSPDIDRLDLIQKEPEETPSNP